MSKTLFAALFSLMVAIPAMAQDDFPRIQIGMGYANLGLPAGGGRSARHGGFSMQTGFNFKPWLGVENYNGFYGLGNRTTLISNIIGARLMGQKLTGGRVVPYGVAGFGGGYITQSNYGYGYGSMMATRLAIGVDVKMNDSMAIRVEVGRLLFHSGTWQSGTNVSGGIVFNIMN